MWRVISRETARLPGSVGGWSGGEDGDLNACANYTDNAVADDDENPVKTVLCVCMLVDYEPGRSFSGRETEENRLYSMPERHTDVVQNKSW